MSDKNWHGLENAIRESWMQYARENYPDKSGFISNEKIERYARYLFATSDSTSPQSDSSKR